MTKERYRDLDGNETDPPAWVIALGTTVVFVVVYLLWRLV